MARLRDCVTLVVLSTDSFEDCWDPFFSLLHTYWPSFDLEILLNTETKHYTHPTLTVRNSQVGIRTERWLTWTESLLLCLEQVKTPFIIMMLDDFFIDGPVDEALLERCVVLMLERGFPTITLTEHGHHRPVMPYHDPELVLINQHARYRLSTSPALWRVDALRCYTHPPENIWQFEVFGSWRARRRLDSFFVANPKALSNGREGVIPYFQAANDTGIVRGAWQSGVKNLFETHGILVDYSRRGFYVPSWNIVSKYLTLRKLLRDPWHCLLGGSLVSRELGRVDERYHG